MTKAQYALGIDLGGTKILGGIVELSTGRVVVSAKRKTPTAKSSESLFDRMADLVHEVSQTPNLPENLKLGGIGVGAAGQINRKDSSIVYAPNLGVPPNYPLGKLLNDRFDLPVITGNDVEAATLGELRFGSGQGYNHFVCMFVGTGIGGGLVHNGKIMKGAGGTAGEVGHMVISAGGRHCGCGGRGHLEAYSSRTAITRTLLGELKRGKTSILRDLLDIGTLPDADSATSIAIRSKVIAKAVAANDSLVMKVLEEAAGYLGLGIASVINAYNPERVILGGGLIEAVDPFFEKVVDIAMQEALPASVSKLEIVRTKLGDFSGLVGAALLVEQI
jgi:glucokinase